MATETCSLIVLALIAGLGGPEIEGVIDRIDAGIQAAERVATRVFVEMELAR